MDSLAMLVFPLTSAYLVWQFNLNFVTSTLLFFGAPSIYLSWRKPYLISKTLKFSVLTVLPIWIIFDYLAHIDQSWFVPTSLRFLNNTLPWSTFVWGFSWIYYVIIWWEAFVDRGRKKQIFPPKVKFLVMFVAVALTLFSLVYWLAPTQLHIHYFYLKFGIAFVLTPLFFALYKHTTLLLKMWPLLGYFSLVAFLHEWAGLVHGHWLYPGTRYIGTITIWNSVLPIDELLFWVILGAPALIAWYEVCADDWE